MRGTPQATEAELGQPQRPLPLIVWVSRSTNEPGGHQRADELACSGRADLQGVDQVPRAEVVTAIEPLERGDAHGRTPGRVCHPFLQPLTESHREGPEEVLESLVLPLLPGHRIAIVLSQPPRAHSCAPGCESNARLIQEL